MNILILGAGGREHAFAWKIQQSSKCDRLFIAPGNAGTAALGNNVPISPTSFTEIADFVLANNINLVVVGPEEPLALGIRDYFRQRADLKNIPLVGPDKKGAQLESSKDFAKRFMHKYHIPTAAYATFDREYLNAGLKYLGQQSMPIVLKADGLAAGKGVVICNSLGEAEQTLREMLEGAKFGKASAKVVIEEFLSGIELSVFVVTDGNNYKILPSAKDYKRIGEGDSGPNTGGMGAVSPVPFADDSFMQKIEQRIIKPTIKGLQAENIDYRGFIFFGLINVNGEPMVIEYNARMGDPETQVVLPRISNDLVDVLMSCALGTLDQIEVVVDARAACTVVMVSGGYPGDYQKGLVIHGLNSVSKGLLFHAGTKQEDGKVKTSGGRVLAITGFGENIENALMACYESANTISWQDVYYRHDIGKDLLAINNSVETSSE